MFKRTRIQWVEAVSMAEGRIDFAASAVAVVDVATPLAAAAAEQLELVAAEV